MPAPLAHVAWAYAGEGGPEHWGSLKPEFALCANGRRQSPIDVRGGIAVDVEPVQFAYRPAPFRVVDSGRHLQMTIYGGGFSLLGKKYELLRVHFHRPAETTIAGKIFDLEAQLVHKADDGRLAIISVLFETGAENPLVQQALNHLPLEKGGEVSPPGRSVDVTSLLPSNRHYATYLGSLTDAAVQRGRPLAGDEDAAAGFARAARDLRPPLSAQRPSDAACLRSHHQGIALGKFVPPAHFFARAAHKLTRASFFALIFVLLRRRHQVRNELPMQAVKD